MARGYCKAGDHYPEEMIAESGEEVDALVYNDGSAANRYADGTVGLSAEARERAGADEEPMCPEHLCPVSWTP